MLASPQRLGRWLWRIAAGLFAALASDGGGPVARLIRTDSLQVEATQTPPVIPLGDDA